MLAKELLDLGQAYERSGKLDMARRSYARVIALFPEEIAAYDRLSRLAIAEGDLSQALAFLDKGLAVNDKAAPLWNLRGTLYSAEGDIRHAREAFQIALGIEPDHTGALINLAKLLNDRANYEEAEELLKKAIDSGEQKSPDAIIALANCLYRQHRFGEAKKEIAKAMTIDSSSAEAHMLRAMLHFSTGELKSAWQENEWRFQLPNWRARRSFPRKQQWLGEPLHDASLLVHAEQGLGDSLQFIRFIPEIAKRDCEIIIDIQPELYKLCSTSFELPNVRWSRSEKMPSSDLQIPMLSVPGVLGITYDNLPPFKPYIFAREREVQEWRGKLNKMTGIAWGREVERRKQTRVGLVWAGSSKNPDNQNRSMKFYDIQPVVEANRDHAIFFSLQKEQRSEHPDVIDLGEQLTDFAITAAIIENLDLIIAVDTSIAHLAGAMGKPVWTMLSHTPDWRWVIGEERTKWYPSMSLFSQLRPGDWSDVTKQVNDTLAA
jgi:tetratricopeptide (TPR) repeat protein